MGEDDADYQPGVSERRRILRFLIVMAFISFSLLNFYGGFLPQLMTLVVSAILSIVVIRAVQYRDFNV